MTTKEARALHVVEELQPRHSRPTQRHHERVQRAPRSSDLDVAEVPPVDLGLLTRDHVQPGERLGLGPGPDLGDEPTKVRLAALVAPIAHHVKQARGVELGILGQGRFDEGKERVEHARTNSGHLRP